MHLTPSLTRIYRELLSSFSFAEQELQEHGTPMPTEELERSALAFLTLYVEQAAMHRDADPKGTWRTFLVDFVHAFTYTDADGVMHNALAEYDIDNAVLDACALDEAEDESETRTNDERLEALREALLEIKASLDELSFF